MEKYYWLNKDSQTFLSRGYLKKGQTAQERIKQIAKNAEKILKIEGFADKFEDYMARGFYSLSTPVWSNFGNKKGCPVSCFNSYIPDTMDGILYKVAEVGMMSKIGGGASGYFGDVRGRGALIQNGEAGESSGPTHFMEMFEKVTSVVTQGSNRRGAFAAYLPIDHPDIEEFLAIKSDGHPIQDMSFAVCVSDEWMEGLKNKDKDKRKIWAKIVKKKFEKGYPYLLFTDTANKNAPQVYKDKGRKIKSSNLCNEIMLSSNEDESFVCVLSSLNLLHWEEIKDTDAVETLIYFLDAVNEEFVEKSAEIPFLQHAHNFAKRQRALGMGVLGWHSFLQSKMIPFESMEAKYFNNIIFKTIRERSDKASENLAKMFGEPEMLKGYGRRNVTTLAIAPTTSSSFILGQVSSGIEPYDSNFFVEKTAKGEFSFKNEVFLGKLLEEKGKNTPEIWLSILEMGGSVQHLNFLSEHEKNVFKTWLEISQKEVIIQASQRQKYLDQGQSLNIKVHHTTLSKEVSKLMIEAWELGVKGLYYQRNTNPSQELARENFRQNLLGCSSCEG